MIWKFFTLKVVQENGVTHKATWNERFQWLKRGCPLRDERVVKRYCDLVHKRAHHS